MRNFFSGIILLKVVFFIKTLFYFYLGIPTFEVSEISGTITINNLVLKNNHFSSHFTIFLFNLIYFHLDSFLKIGPSPYGFVLNEAIIENNIICDNKNYKNQ